MKKMPVVPGEELIKGLRKHAFWMETGPNERLLAFKEKETCCRECETVEYAYLDDIFAKDQ